MLHAIVSDIHANLPAWKAVLKDIRVNKTDSIICLGDVVGYGPMPQLVFEDVRDNVDLIVLGNHDAVVCGRFDENNFTSDALAAIRWTRSQLDNDAADFFGQLPTALEGDNFFAAHAEIANPERFGYIEDQGMARESFLACQATLIFVGHTHRASIFIMDTADGSIHPHPAADFSAADGMRYIVNVGSVGDPRDRDDIRACYCLFDDESLEITYRHIAFDLAAYRLSLKQSGLSIYPYFLSSIDGHPEVIPAQDWKPRISVVRPTRATSGIRLTRGAITHSAPPDITPPDAIDPPDNEEQVRLLAEEARRKEDIDRKHKAFLVKSRSELDKAQREKQRLASKLKALREAAIARRGPERID